MVTGGRLFKSLRREESSKADAELAEEIVSRDQADLVAIGRAMLDNPRWGLHAAASLGVDVDYAPQYLRARPNNWLGFNLVHPDTQPITATRQMDRPASGAGWDRPDVKAPVG